MSVSCLYAGTVRHRRRRPSRQFTYGLTLAYLDLEELPNLLGGRLTRPWPGLLRVRRRDLLGDPHTPLQESVRETVRAATGIAPAGPIRVLTQPRSFGLCFNPVSFYYCFEPSGREVETIVAEVTNTPWRERHAYVLAAGTAGAAEAPDATGDASGRLLRDTAEKQLHVSPLMGMDQRYRFAATAPGETLSLHIEVGEDAQPVFDATLGLRRRDLNRGSLRRFALRNPFASVRVLALIYLQALRARLAGATYHPHPTRTSHA